MSTHTDLNDLIATGEQFGVIYADPPWRFRSWTTDRWKGDGAIFTPAKSPEYPTMSLDQLAALPIDKLAAKNSVLFLWGTWAHLLEVCDLIPRWGFKYRGGAFNWMKADSSQVDLFPDEMRPQMGLGYWTRQDSEFCLLAGRGKPKRRPTGTYVGQGIIERRREHSRKPDCVYGRIERLLDGPYLELFARSTRAGWTSWGLEVDKFGEVK